MRNILALMAVSTMLTACGGGTGPTFAGGNAPPSGSGDGGGSGTGGGATGSGHTFVDPTETRTYQGIGGAQTFEFREFITLSEGTAITDFDFADNSGGQTAEVFAGQSSTARNSNIQITFDPREAVYTLQINDPLSNTNISTRFQDPSSRTDFGGAEEPQFGVPELQFQNITYFESGDGNPISPVGGSGSGTVITPDTNTTPPLGLPDSTIQLASFFLQTPGTSTQYVTFAGFVRNEYSYGIDDDRGQYFTENSLSRGAFAFGERTPSQNVPTTGTFSLSGNMVASMINNPTLDGEAGAVFESYFQWIEGTVGLTVDFAANQVRDIEFVGSVSAPQLPALTQFSPDFDPSAVHSFIPAGSGFEASGSATIDLINAGGFLGQVDTARFIARNGNLFADGTSLQNIQIDGTSIDGAFFGPNGEEVGGGFRIVGGIPDQRIDILGTFTAGRN